MIERIRGRAGQEARARRLRRTHGLCEHCEKAGRTELATAVDHIIPLAQGGEDVDDNTRNLCDACHAAATAEQFGHEHQVRLGACDDSGMPTDPRHPWNREQG